MGKNYPINGQLLVVHYPTVISHTKKHIFRFGKVMQSMDLIYDCRFGLLLLLLNINDLS